VSSDRALVRNAADPRQVKAGARLSRRRQAYIEGLHRAMLETPLGRAFIADLLERAGIYNSIWHPSAEIHYLSGRQDFGHELRLRCLAVDVENFMLLEREARDRVKREETETEAGRTPAATEEGGNR
jgi:hypothetical protein